MNLVFMKKFPFSGFFFFFFLPSLLHFFIYCLVVFASISIIIITIFYFYVRSNGGIDICIHILFTCFQYYLSKEVHYYLRM